MAVLENSLKTFDFWDKYALYALPEYICNYIDIRSGYIKILCASLRESSFTFSNSETQDIYQTYGTKYSRMDQVKFVENRL